MTDREVFERDYAAKEKETYRMVRNIVRMVKAGKGDSFGCPDAETALDYIDSQFKGLSKWAEQNVYDEE